MVDSSDMAVFWAVVLARFLIPLLILRYPLPAILAALVLDGVDQTIFQLFTNLPLDGYQGYDKALDVYYLTIAYIFTLRSWTNQLAFLTSRFLYYYRLVGVILFEFLQARWILMLFPNTFEYFFIFYETYTAGGKKNWDPRHMSKRTVIGAAAAIWIFIKLPQEYWIHVAKMDTTDFIKETIYGVPLDAAWGATIVGAPLITLSILAVIALLIGVIWWIFKYKLPPMQRPLKLKADPLPEEVDEVHERLALSAQERIFSSALFEKIVLIGFVLVIFGQILPGRSSSDLQMILGVALLAVVNAFLSHWLARRGRGIESTGIEFVVMSLVNLGLILLFAFILPSFSGSINLANTLFFTLMFTLIVTLFDRYHPVYRFRFSEDRA